jgi:two-component system CheB/CheR fusion protein
MNPSASSPNDSNLPSHIIGIGASAGGLEALERFFRAMPTDSGMAFVVIQHLSPDFKSLMNELLERFTSMAAIPVMGQVEVKPNTIYLLPPRRDIFIEGNSLITHERDNSVVLSLPINTFFRSLAAAWGEKSVAIVLSGTGSDGSNGLLDIRDAGGLVIVETPESSRFDGMPQSAINTGCVDAILKPEDMPAALLAFASNPESRNYSPYAEGGDLDPKLTGLPAILKLLKRKYHIDFHNYKPATIMRRIERRVAMTLEGEDIDSYSQRLLDDTEELDLLYKDLLIGVTRFFRDPEAFTVLQKSVVQEIIKSVPDHEEIRIWVCACSTGEEAYSIAILFLEGFKNQNRTPHLKILATDLHQESLQFAADGIYHQDRLSEMPVEFKNRYFESMGNNMYKVLPHLRKALIFSSHNLLKDPPFTKLHMISCRNLLIYLQSNTQAKAIATFHYALNLNGILFLGASETLGDLNEEMGIIDRHWKIFRKIRESPTLLNMRNQVIPIDSKIPRPNAAIAVQLPRIYDTLLDKFIPAGILINEQRQVVHLFGNATAYIEPTRGRFTGDILNLLPHALSLALNTALRTATKNQLPVVLKGIELNDEQNASSRLILTVDPILEKTANTLFFMIRIESEKQLELVNQPTSPVIQFDPHSETAAQVQELEKELQKARESLQSTVEELETTNEELQASNEELLASNEELQSTNEELHSVNEELYSVNAEHELKIEELNLLSSNLRNLMQSTDTATIFIDNNMLIRLFTPKALDIFNLMTQDIGRNLSHFHPTFDDPELFNDIKQVLNKGGTLEKQLKLENNQSYLRRCMAYQDITGQQCGAVIIYIDTSSITRITQELEDSETGFKLILQTIPNAILVVAKTGEIVNANEFAHALFGFDNDELIGCHIDERLPLKVREKHQELISDYFSNPSIRHIGREKQLEVCRKNGEEFLAEITLAPVKIKQEPFTVIVVNDVTERIKMEQSKQEALDMAVQLSDTKSRFLANMSHEIRTPLNAIMGFAQLGARRNYDAEKNHAFFEKILTSSNHLLTIVNDILDYSKLDANKIILDWVAVKLADLIEESTTMFYESIREKHLELIVELDDDLPEYCLIDPLRLRQILINLLSNAVKFTEQGSIRLHCGMKNQALEFKVIDTGIGIKPDHIDKLFKPFQQIDNSLTRQYGGTGLGLVISQKLVHLMKGSISVTSTPNQGSCFTVTLPYRAVTPTQNSETPTQIDNLDLKGLHILIAEDVELNRLFLEDLFNDMGVQVTSVENGQEALNTVKQKGPEAFDFIFMDIQMPYMNGYEATRHILKLAPDMTVIGMTAYAFESDRQKCLSAGMKDFISKPIKLPELFSLINQYRQDKRTND